MGKNITYKTINGLLRSVTQLSVYDFLNRKIYHKTKGWVSFDVTDEVNQVICNAISECMVSKSNTRERVKKALYERDGDYSFLDSFYIEVRKNGNVRVSNSLSGDVFRYCIRKYMKSI